MYNYSPQNAPSIYFNFRTNNDALAISQQVRIPYSTPSTFYSILNWNAGDEYSSGYAGFQQLPSGVKTIHFSLWSLDENDPEFKPIKGIKGGTFDPFTNEKKGRKFVAPFNFDEKAWYEFTVKIAHPDNNNTIYDLYVSKVETDEKFHVVQMNYPRPMCLFRHSYGAFLEDFLRNDYMTREMHLRQGVLIKAGDASPLPWHQQELSFDANGAKNLNGGAADGYLFLQSGNNIKLTTENYTSFDDPSYTMV